ncbi:iminophenyl-pyruvate dimer synthase VioB [Pseudoalteromonas sp. T1lg23B]|uniref:iminophenyl-pyruvate dimer synthase VioB n=1 Tax=Pseudoalteromonas sp. T1lg23B TaxID=2077097 RepID=UPI000CF68459|nr:iminophenyl-pyruvate dimer synthase VioB [Pseudoalteromonas sp. T1lg23B]
MSVLDLPRIHFKGVARVNVPTANRNVHNTLEIATNTVLHKGQAVDIKMSPKAYHEYLQSLGPKLNAQGMADENGQFSLACGYNMSGNNHFSWHDTEITALQIRPGECLQQDPLLGGTLNLWGHYNEYLRTSFNRARWVDNDPTRPDSALIYAGQLTISAPNSEANTAHVFSADIDCTHGVRWLNPGYIEQPQPHGFAADLAAARLFQFTVSKDSKDFIINQLNLESEFLEHLKLALAEPDVKGLIVQYCVSNLSPPSQPNMAVFCDLHGSIGLWREHEMATCPAGRILQPENHEHFSNIALQVSQHGLSLNMAISVGHQGYLEALPVDSGLPPKLADKVSLGDLQLQSKEGQTLAMIPEALYNQSLKTAGIIDIPIELNASDLANQSLKLVSDKHSWHEIDWYVQGEQHITYMESPNPKSNQKSNQLVEVYSYFRGTPRAINKLASHNCTTQLISCAPYVETAENGRGQFLIEALSAGSGQIFLGEQHSPLQVRVLSDDWALLDVPDEQVDYDFLYENVMAYYEFIYPFMADKVFSMADKCKCETYARLMWQMCDPNNKHKSYYMPSTREMSLAQSYLFLKYLGNVENSAIPKSLPPCNTELAVAGKIKSKAQLIQALRDAVDLELSIMLQYLYSAYSLPTYAAGEQFVKAGRWTSEQLALVNGSADRRHNSGWRGVLLEIAHEEMIHYLVVNNLLMSLGEPFYAGTPVLAEQAHRKFGLDTDFSFEPFSAQMIAKFVRFEWPTFIPTIGRSIADFYADIKQAFEELPDLYPEGSVSSGGEHHLFLNEVVNRNYPGYQFEVYNRETALFAIQFVTEQGEGVCEQTEQFELSHFNRLRQISKALNQQDIPFESAYPVLKNPVFEARVGCNLVTNPQAQSLMRFYQECHELMFQIMMHHFAQTPRGSLRRSRLMNAAIDLMTGILRPLSVHLMTLPSGIEGRNAGPPVPRAVESSVAEDYAQGCAQLSQRCATLADMARNLDLIQTPDTQIELLEFFQQQMADLAAGNLSREG